MASERELAPGILEERFDSASEFMDALRLINHRWVNSGPWIFRGHSNADWSLVPAAHRLEAARVFARGSSMDDFRDPYGFGIEWEKDLIRDFFYAADRSGLPVPIGRDQLHVLLDGLADEWPSPELVPLLALAQHYGVPTRLLDWTTQGRVAAYFSALPPAEPCSELAVWAMHAEFVSEWGYQGYAIKSHIVGAPRSSNPNLHAQSGCFSYLRFRYDVPEHAREQPMPLDSVVTRLYQGTLAMAAGEVVQPSDSGCAMKKLVLPRSQAEALLQLAYLDGASALTLFPGYVGVARYLAESRKMNIRRGEFQP